MVRFVSQGFGGGEHVNEGVTGNHVESLKKLLKGNDPVEDVAEDKGTDDNC